MKWEPARSGQGMLQSGLPKGPPNPDARRAFGLNHRGVVIKLFPRDTPPPGPQKAASTYASVVTYGAVRCLLPRVQVSQPVGSLHTGQVGGLRETTLSTTGNVLDLDHSDPATFDGSHVVISYFDDDLSQPYISAILEHPASPDTITSEDGKPLKVRWNGAIWGLEGDGSFLLDLRNAFSGDLLSGGEEPPPSGDEVAGCFKILLPATAKMSVEIDGENAMILEKKAADAKITLGDGAVKVAIADHVRELYNSLADYLANDYKLLTAVGLTASASASGTPPAPSWNPRIESTHVVIPDEPEGP